MKLSGQLKIRCSNHGEGYQWTRELGALKKHLESDTGCDCVMVECPNKCYFYKTVQRKCLQEHLSQFCPEVLLPCPNKCGSEKIKRKAMANHQSQCPQEPVKCPFTDAGCDFTVCRHPCYECVARVIMLEAMNE